MFVSNHPAMKIGKYIVISDLHIGFEYEFWSKGFYIPPQTDVMLKEIEEIMKIARTKNVIINGDLKHNIPVAKKYEEVELAKFVESMKSLGKLILVRGNHDGGIEKIVDIDVVNEMKIGNTLVTHGHRRAGNAKRIVIGHNHPVLRFDDKIGARYYERVWLVDDKNKIIIMPAFNSLIGGKAVNDGEFQGPIAKKMKNPDIYLLDGTFVGKLNDFLD